MADEHLGDHDSAVESMMDKIKDKIAGDHDSSSSDSDDDILKAAKVQAVKSKIYRLFGREQPVHKVFGGGKPADILLWRDKKVSGRVLGGATIIWTLFELLEYHLITLVCHALILFLAVFFVWSNAANFLNKSPPKIPEVVLPEKCVLEFASQLRVEINRGFAVLHDIASGRDLKNFLAVIFGLWILSIVGSSCNFLTLFYITFVLLFTVPYAYEKYEDQVDPIAEKAMIEIKKQYAVLDEKVLSKILTGPLKAKKKD